MKKTDVPKISNCSQIPQNRVYAAGCCIITSILLNKISRQPAGQLPPTHIFPKRDTVCPEFGQFRRSQKRLISTESVDKAVGKFRILVEPEMLCGRASKIGSYVAGVWQRRAAIGLEFQS
jgi:hypothetical protein